MARWFEIHVDSNISTGNCEKTDDDRTELRNRFEVEYRPQTGSVRRDAITYSKQHPKSEIRNVSFILKRRWKFLESTKNEVTSLKRIF